MQPKESQARPARGAGARLRPHLAGLNTAGGLLVVAYAVLATISTQVTIRQTLFRGYLLLLLPLAGFLLAALALAGVVGRTRGQRAAHPLVRLSAWGTCIVWLVLWAVIFIITTYQI
jgi:hypothetical protein